MDSLKSEGLQPAPSIFEEKGSEKESREYEDLSHEEMMEITQSSITTLIKSDPLLSDLPADALLEEILAQIAVEHGRSITIFVSRDPEPTLKVVVPQDATVMQLKKAIARHFQLYQNRINNRMKVSWKYIWRAYNLNYESILLEDNDTKILDYGVSNKTTLTFKKKFNKRRRM